MLGKGFFLIGFARDEDPSSIMAEGPWSVMGFPQIMGIGIQTVGSRNWGSQNMEYPPRTAYRVLWPETLQLIGKALGRLIKIDDKTWRRIGWNLRLERLLVQINTTNPLPNFIWIGSINRKSRLKLRPNFVEGVKPKVTSFKIAQNPEENRRQDCRWFAKM